MRNGSKVLFGLFILIAAAISSQAAVVTGYRFAPAELSVLEYSIIETPFTPQLDTPLARLDLMPAAEATLLSAPAPAPVMNLDPRSVVLGGSTSYAPPLARRYSVGDGLFEASALSLVALNIADYFSTREALRFPGLQEGNPLMKGVVKDPTKFAAVKIGIAVASYISLKSLYKKNRTLGWAVSVLSNFAMSYVVSNNLRLINWAKSR